MLSPFSSALAKLDDSLQTIQNQLERVRGGLDADDDQLRTSLADACHYATILSDLISNQRAIAPELDRGPLDQLIHELKSLRSMQRRRLKLLNLAAELSAGRINHHRVNRTQALNELRVQAVKELRGAAAGAAEEKDLPGPRSSKWLHWACGLQEETDAAILQVLRRDFPALEEFIIAIDEQYWESGAHHATEFSSAIAEGSEETTTELPSGPPIQPSDTSAADQDRLARDLLAKFEKVLHPAGAAPASRPTESRPLEPPRPAEIEQDAEKRVAFTETRERPSSQPPRRLEKERIDKTAAQEFFKVVNAWQLDDGQARRLIGISRGQLNQLREGEHVALEPEKLTRISLLVAISKGLNVLYGSRRGEKWVHRPNSNPLFDGTEPLKYMLKEGVEGLIKVRELVGVWSGYISPEETP